MTTVDGLVSDASWGAELEEQQGGATGTPFVLVILIGLGQAPSSSSTTPPESLFT